MNALRLIAKPITGRHVLFGLIGFFGVMLIVNGIFLYYAVGTFNGFETTNAYSRGLTYNARIAADAAQESRGWTASARHDARGEKIVIEVKNRRGAGIAGLMIQGEIRRPATDRQDQKVTFKEGAPARYAIPIELAAGQWVLLAEAREPGKSGEPAFRFKQRLWVKDLP